MLTASSDLAVTTQQGDRRAQYWAFFTQDEMALWHRSSVAERYNSFTHVVSAPHSAPFSLGL
jgi:hypothetical protein